MRVFLMGGSGVIGTALTGRLREEGHQPVILTRSPERMRARAEHAGVECVGGDPMNSGPWQDALDGCDAVVNLVGANLFAERWSEGVKRKIRESRVRSTENLVAGLERARSRPVVLAQGSALGYYGTHGDEELTESSPPGTDFLARTCVEWEGAARRAEPLGVRVVYLRTGVVLARGEGALGAMTPLFRWVPGGAAPVGGGSPLGPGRGRQWMSWVHLRDIADLFVFAIEMEEARGPMNGTAPSPARNVEFSRELAKAVHRPFLPIGPPDLMLRLLMGEVAETVILGQRVLPEAALRLGFRFRFPTVREALADLFEGGGANEG